MVTSNVLRLKKPDRILYIDALSNAQARANIRGIKRAYQNLSAGSTVATFDYRLRAQQSTPTMMNEELFDFARSFNPDFIHIGKGESIDAGTIERIKATTGAKIGHFYGDYRPTPPEYVVNLSKVVNVTMIQGSDEKLKQRYLDAGCKRIEFLNCGTDTGIFFKHDVAKEYDVVFMANYSKPQQFEWMAGRVELMQALASAGVGVHIFGTGWTMFDQVKNVTIHPFVSGEEFGYECSKAKIAIAYGTNQIRGYTSWPRVLNSMAAGCFVLTRYFPGLEDIFENSHDLVWFAGIDHAVSLAKYYLENNIDREKIAAQGREIVALEHTWDKRVRQVLKYVYTDKDNQ